MRFEKVELITRDCHVNAWQFFSAAFYFNQSKYDTAALTMGWELFAAVSF
jgi:hypothetical protein